MPLLPPLRLTEPVFQLSFSVDGVLQRAEFSALASIDGLVTGTMLRAAHVLEYAAWQLAVSVPDAGSIQRLLPVALTSLVPGKFEHGTVVIADALTPFTGVGSRALSVVAGITVVAQLRLQQGSFVSQLLAILFIPTNDPAFVSFGVPFNPATGGMHAAIELHVSVSLGGVVELRFVSALVEVTPQGDARLGLAVELEVLMPMSGGQRLLLRGGGKYPTVTGAALLFGELEGCWRRALFLPGLTVCDLYVEMEFIGDPLPSALRFRGAAQVGSNSLGVAMAFDRITGELFFRGHASRMGLLDLLTIVTGQPAPNTPVTAEHVVVQYGPRAVTIGGVHYRAGFLLKGTLRILGVVATAEFRARLFPPDLYGKATFDASGLQRVGGSLGDAVAGLVPSKLRSYLRFGLRSVTLDEFTLGDLVSGERPRVVAIVDVFGQTMTVEFRPSLGVWATGDMTTEIMRHLSLPKFCMSICLPLPVVNPSCSETCVPQPK